MLILFHNPLKKKRWLGKNSLEIVILKMAKMVILIGTS